MLLLFFVGLMKRKKPPICDETDGLVETAYDVILVLLTHDHLLMILGEKEIRILACEKEKWHRGGAIFIIWRKRPIIEDW